MAKNRQLRTHRDFIVPLVQMVILFFLAGGLFWPTISGISSQVMKISEIAHVMITPIAVLLLIYLRRAALFNAIHKGSFVGVFFVLFGLVLLAGSIWPFSYGYVRDLALIPVLTGIVWIACGRQVVKLSTPMLLLVMISIPVGSRLYASLIIRPETYTIAATAKILDCLPNVDTSVRGTDLFFSKNQENGVVALGQSNRGARLLWANLTIGIFVIFSCIRPWPRLLFALLATIPIVLFCNFFRFLSEALVVMYSGLEPASSVPRHISSFISLLVCYGLFYLVCDLHLNLFVEEPSSAADAEVINA